MTAASPAGLVLAAGGGSRFGGPKALVRTAGGRTWVARAVEALVAGGAAPVYVVVGAAAAQVREVVPVTAHVVEAATWQEGMGASLRAGLAVVAAEAGDAPCVLVMLVDTPGVGPDVVRRLAAHATPDSLARAAYAGEPGHPVLLGRDHWEGVAALAGGDRGARDYLRTHDVHLVECGDIGTGLDIDTIDDLRRHS